MQNSKITTFFLPLVLLIVVMTQPTSAQVPAGPSTPTDAEIRQVLVDRIDTAKRGVGIVVGLVTPEGRRLVAYGKLAAGDPRVLDGDTVFEIGSMTKVFTSLVLMDMVQRGEVTVDDPVAKYLPPSVHVPERGGKVITLKDLSTQTSGLPRMPTNFHPRDLGNPYADYTPDQLYAFLSSYALPRDIGEKYEYSNLGVGLLGLTLSLRAKVDYGAMVEARILQLLGMKDTAITLSPALQGRLAAGHDANLQPVPNWDMGALAGAGALRSTANDLLVFLAANLGFVPTPLAPAMAAEISVERPTGTPNLDIAYAWHIFTSHDRKIYWHNGGTGGYRSFMGFDPVNRIGVVVLTNSANEADDIGRHLLDPATPFGKFGARKEHHETAVDAKTLEGYVGRYQLAPNFVVAVTQAGDHLFIQATGQGRSEVFSESPGEFFSKIVDAQFTFVVGPDGKTTGLVLHQNGRNLPAKRLE